VHALGALEGEPERFHALLAPFRAMVDTQIAYAKAFRGARVRHLRPRAPKVRRSPVPSLFRDRAEDLVCIYGEANAWPYRSKERAQRPDELVHWVARRMATGERFDVVAAPRNPLAPGTAHHTALSNEELAAGCSMGELALRWRAFVRDTDVVCSWGRYATALFVESGGFLPEVRVDLRQVARDVARGKVGTLDDVHRSMGSPSTLVAGSGRAGARLGQIVAIAEHFLLGIPG
jgi:hypothetical protein